MALLTHAMKEKIRQIKLLALDVDGVLTSGQIHYSPQGEQMKTFNTQDGMGLKLLRDSGLNIAIITRRASSPLTKRLQELSIDHVYQGQLDKLEAFNDLMAKCQLPAEAIAYVGDDIPDITVMKAAGFSVAVANGRPPVFEYAHWRTQACGGFGAVREICELIMDVQGTWETNIQNHL